MQKPKWFSISFFKDWALWTLSFASGGPTVIIALVFFFQSKEPPKSGLLTVFGVCSLFAAWVAGLKDRRLRIEVQKTFQKTVKQRPRLRVEAGGFCEITKRWLTVIKTVADPNPQGFKTFTPYSCLVLRIENDPITSTAESIATQLSTRLTFYDSFNTELFSYEGRWADTEQPTNYAGIKVPNEQRTIDIPIGTRRDLDLAIKYHSDDLAYGINYESYAHPQIKNPAWTLGSGDYSLKVRLRGASVDQTWLLKFRNPKGAARLEPLSCEEV